MSEVPLYVLLTVGSLDRSVLDHLRNLFVVRCVDMAVVVN